MKIAVRGGHTKASTGSNAILNELIEDRRVTEAVIKYLKQIGHNVLNVTPQDNMTYPYELNYGINKANEWKAELFISIHFNKAYNNYNGAIGSEVCVYSKFDAAQRVVNKLASLGFKNRGQKVRNDLGELTKTNMKAMIIEVCFVEATEDVNIYKKNGADKIGKVIAEGISNKTIEIPSPSAIDKKYRVVCGWYSEKSNAITQQNKLKTSGFDSFLVAHNNNGKAGYRVVAGTYSNKSNAEIQQKKLKEKNFDSFLVAV